MFLIDAHQMRNNKPVIFSTWGLKYYPSVDMHELELEQAIKDFIYGDQKEKDKIIAAYEKEMRESAKNLDFERAAELRDLIIEIRAND